MPIIKRIAELYREPSARELLQRQLDNARREKTTASMQRESWQATESMLEKRIQRISAELRVYEGVGQ